MRAALRSSWRGLCPFFVLQFPQQHYRPNLMESRLILINLLIKLGVAAAVSSSLVRSKEFKSLLFREERTLSAENLSGAVDGAADHARRLDSVFVKEFSGGRSEF